MSDINVERFASDNLESRASSSLGEIRQFRHHRQGAPILPDDLHQLHIDNARTPAYGLQLFASSGQTEHLPIRSLSIIKTWR